MATRRGIRRRRCLGLRRKYLLTPLAGNNVTHYSKPMPATTAGRMMEHVEMGREVRMVPADWKHPTQGGFYADGSVRYVALFDGSDFEARAADWDEEAAKWGRGEFPSYAEESDRSGSYAEWAGDRPDPSDYMPNWPEAERTHYMMYETTSEGSPISPAFATPEDLAQWLADNGASSFGASTASYESWLRVCKGGWAPSAVVDAHGIRSGVEALSEKADPE